jgi:tetratricopeptide (TPR) repeat protein
MIFGKVDVPRPSLDIDHTYMGFTSSKARLALMYSAADYYVMPSLADNYPNTMLESMSCGTPVIAHDVGGIPDLLKNGQTGYLVPPGNIYELATTIYKCILNTSKRHHLSDNCRKEILKICRPDFQAKTYLQHYQQTISAHAKAARPSGLKSAVIKPAFLESDLGPGTTALLEKILNGQPSKFQRAEYPAFEDFVMIPGFRELLQTHAAGSIEGIVNQYLRMLPRLKAYGLSEMENQLYKRLIDFSVMGENPNGLGSETLLALGNLARDRNDDEIAVSCYLLASETDPSQDKPHYLRSALFRKRERLPESLNAINAAIATLPDNHTYWYNKAVILRDLKRYDAAATAIGKAVEYCRGNPEYLFMKGVIHLEAGKADKALNAFRQAGEQDAQSPKYRFYQGVALKELGWLEKSLRAFKEAAAVDTPYLASISIFKGACLRDLGRQSEALDSFRHAIALDANNIAARIKEIEMLLLLDQTKAAETACAAALKRTPDNQILKDLKRDIDSFQYKIGHAERDEIQ